MVSVQLESVKLCTLQRFDCHRSKGNVGGRPLLAARPKTISTSSCQAARHSTRQLLQKGMPLPLRRNGVRIQYLPRTLPVLSGSNKPSSLRGRREIPADTPLTSPGRASAICSPATRIFAKPGTHARQDYLATFYLSCVGAHPHLGPPWRWCVTPPLKGEGTLPQGGRVWGLFKT